MSLINQALRKAQRDRTPNRMADPGTAAQSQAIPAGSNGMKPTLIIGLLLAVAVLVGLVAGLSVVLIKSGDEPAPQVTQASRGETTPAPVEPASTHPPATPPSAEPAPVIEPIAQTAQAPEKALPLERDNTSSVVEELRKAREAAEAKIAAEAKAAEEAAARAAAKPSQDIIDWLTNAQISGVKLSDNGNKVILNGKSYDVGEYANFQLGLKVLIIQEKRVLFVDKNGKKYMKRI